MQATKQKPCDPPHQARAFLGFKQRRVQNRPRNAISQFGRHSREVFDHQWDRAKAASANETGMCLFRGPTLWYHRLYGSIYRFGEKAHLWSFQG